MYTQLGRHRDTYARSSIRGASLVWPLVLFTVGDIALILTGEAFKTRLIWYLRFADLVDLLLVAPLYLVSLVLFYEQFLSRAAAPWLRRAFLALAVIFMYGHAMHVTANAINTFSTEIRDYRAIIPADAYALIVFLDETLSHWIVFLARFSLFACLLELEISAQTGAEHARSPWSGLALGAIYGVWQAIVFVEGQKVLLVPVLAVALGVLWVWRWRQRKIPLARFLRTGPLTAFVAGLLPSMLLGLGLYALLVGGFTEPSKLGV